MIAASRQRGALRALSTIFTLTRNMALTGESGVAEILDYAELLPVMMLSEKDETQEFRRYLQEIASRYPEFQLAADKYERAD